MVAKRPLSLRITSRRIAFVREVNDVNLENIRPENALLFEAMRFGLHRAIDYNYFEAFAGEPLPPVAGG